MTDLPIRWRDRYRINVYESDALGRATIAALCDYCQDSASRHYYAIDKLIGPLLLPSQIWALTRLEIEIDKMPAWDEIVEVETWSRGIRKISAYRDFLLSHAGGGTFARGTTTWVVLDRQTMGMARLSDFGGKWPSTQDGPAFDRDAAKVEPLKSPAFGKPFEVRYGDIDVNQHVNSVNYIRWMSDALGKDIIESNRLKRIAVNFLDEALLGDEVMTGREKLPDGGCLCNAVRLKDSKEVCRAKFELEPVQST